LLSYLWALAWNAPISGDEYVHLEQGYAVVDFFSSFGKDTRALNTPVTNLKYYGQSVDNLSALFVRVFAVDNVFRFRHLLNSFLAWILLLFAFKFGRQLKDDLTGVLAVLFLLLSPRFLGHSLNNLKDIPFALGYLASLYYSIKWLKQLPYPSNALTLKLILAIAFTISVRAAGVLLICYLGLFALIWVLKNKVERIMLGAVLKQVALVSIVSYFLGLLFWPYGLENPLWHPVESLIKMSNYPVVMRQLFDGKVYWSDQLPFYYILKMFAITIPVGIVCLFLISILIQSFAFTKPSRWKAGVLYFAVVFPLVFVTAKHSNLYGGARHLLFIYPLIVVLSAYAFSCLIRFKERQLIKAFMIVVLAGLFYHPIKFSINNYPYYAVYFNSFVNGIGGAEGNYELDYYYLSLGELVDKLDDKHIEGDTLVVASNFRFDGYHLSRRKNIQYKYVPYYNRYETDWDVGLFVAAHLYPYNQESGWQPPGIIDKVTVDGVTVAIMETSVDKRISQMIVAFNDGSFELADKLAGQVVLKDMRNHTAWLYKGKSLMALGLFEKAKESLYDCLHLVKGYEPALFELGQLALMEGDPHMAIQQWQQLLDINPRYENAILALAKVYLETDRANDAVDCLQTGQKMLPGSKKIKNEIAKYYQSLKI